jgi:23S rRNA maturation mini-RNase III
MGFERWWLPAAPKVKKPRSTYNAVSLAYLGDCIYEVSLLPSIYLLLLGYVEKVHIVILIGVIQQLEKLIRGQICPSMMKPIHHSLVIYALHFSYG